MAANPTLGWDRIPVYGWWFDNPGVPASGYIEMATTQRVRRVDGRAIYAGGTSRVVTIGKPEDRDEVIAAAVKAKMKARSQALLGAEFDEAAWEERWNRHLAAAIFTSYWAADDPDVTPSGAGEDGYQVTVREVLDSGAGKPYLIQPLMAHLDLPIPGINLADIDVPPGTPSIPAPVYAKNQPGGIAGLDAQGRVVDAFGNVVGEVDLNDVRQAVADELAENPPEVNASWDNLDDKPEVIAAGTTQAQARQAIAAAPQTQAVPTGGTTGQVLAKSSNANHALTWINPPAGGGGGPVDYADVPAGTTFTVEWDGTAWPTERPSSRTDLHFIFRGGPNPPEPPVALAGKDYWAAGAAQ